ncbi:hypothetical protein JW898_05370 [Candidatus Woesearchaeota archaeon]|nr:hypothetical protein [Candidatus Woesearchaeota archaeon]
MGVGGKKKEMLFILGQFLKETDRKFSETPLLVSISKAEFIDGIREMQIIKKKERAVYRNLEDLEKEKYVVYDNKNLSLSRKGFNEYEKIRQELDALNKVCCNMEAGKIKFKRKTQTKLK